MVIFLFEARGQIIRRAVCLVVPGLVPDTHVLTLALGTWMAGTPATKTRFAL
jgi:hypothetical protein